MVVAIGDRSRRSSVIVVTEIITLLVVSAAPSMAKGTASVEPASGAEKVPTTRPKAVIRAYGIWWGRERRGILRRHAGGDIEGWSVTARASNR